MNKFAFMFPGQGTQFIKMGEYFYNSNLISRETYMEAKEVLGIDVANLCFSGKISDINSFTNMQIAIVTTEIAIYRAYKQDIGIDPQFFLGHSIGEYAALVAAGAVDFQDVLKILKKRGELVEKILNKNSGYMTIVENVNSIEIEKLICKLNLENEVYISCFNTKEQFALSGTKDGMERIENSLVENGATISPLIFSPPIHSPLMESVREEFLEYLNTIQYYTFRAPIITNVTGNFFSDSKKIPELMANQLVKPVQFSKSTNLLYQYGIDICVEMSPKKLLLDFIDSRKYNKPTFCYGIKAHREEFKTIIDSNEYSVIDKPSFVGNCLAILAATENRSIENDEFLYVQRLYKKLKKLYQSKTVIGAEEGQEILQELIKALKIKKLEKIEIKIWIKMLLDNTNTFYKYDYIYKQIG